MVGCACVCVGGWLGVFVCVWVGGWVCAAVLCIYSVYIAIEDS